MALCETRMIVAAMLLCTGALWTTAARGADEIDAIVARIKAPARYADHHAKFSAAKETFVLKDNAKTVEKEFWTIKDGDKYVAVYDAPSTQLDMITFDPTRTVEKPPFKDYYSWGTLLGTRITTNPWFMDMRATGDSLRHEFTGGGETLSLTVTQTWNSKTHGEAVYAMVLRCDPVLGYVWDATTTFSTDKGLDDKGQTEKVEMFNWQVGVTGWTQLHDQRWPNAWTHERTVFLRDDSKIVGFWMNPESNDRSKFKKVMVKEGGYVAQLPDKEGRGIALVHVEKGKAAWRNNTCNMWADSHNYLQMPAMPDAKGMYRVQAKWRFLQLPKEVVSDIMSRIDEMDDLGHGK